MNYTDLPIYKVAFDLNIYFEKIVRNFEKYNKYSIGTELRNTARDILFMIHRTNISTNKKENITLIRDRCEDVNHPA